MKKGFTLIELLGVIVILGLIVAVAIPSFVESNKQAQINEEKDFENTLKLAVRDYINYYGDSSLCDNVTDGKQDCIDNANNLSNIYIKNGHKITLSTKSLISVGFLKSSLVDPQTNKKMENEIVMIIVTNNNGTLEYEYERK